LIGGSWNEPVLLASNGRFGIGTLALDCFMLLSGFLLMKAYTARPNVLDYWQRRFLRIYPPYAISIFLIIVMAYFLSADKLSSYLCSKDFIQFIENFSLFHQHYVLPGVFNNSLHKLIAVDGSIWSLPYEILLYAIIPLLFLLNNKSIINLLLIASILLFLFLNQRTLEQLPLFDLNVLAHLCIPFLIGVFLSNSFNKFQLLLAFAGLSLLYFYDKIYLSSIVIFTAEAFLMYFLLAYFKQSQLLNKYSLPDLSYGVFLYGFFIQQACIELFPLSKFGFSFYLCISLLGTVIFALFSWYCIEVPFLKLKQKIA
jgi:peptidoglycan/LPS O-acetylase OafA/YrhL